MIFDRDPAGVLPGAVPTLGDDLPFVSMRYKNVPEGYRFIDLRVPSAALRLTERWPEYAAAMDSWFAEYEIEGHTLAEFKMKLQSTLLVSADTLERHLEVYDQDIAKPILGRTETVTFNDLKETGSSTADTTSTPGVTRTTVSSSTDVPRDAPENDKPDQRTRTEDSSRGTDSAHTGGTSSTTKTGSVVTELSDLGVRPNYESLNGFLDNNRTDIQECILLFRPCFTMYERYAVIQ